MGAARDWGRQWVMRTVPGLHSKKGSSDGRWWWLHNSMNVPTNATDLHAEEWLRQKEREVERTRTEKDTPCKRHSKGSWGGYAHTRIRLQNKQRRREWRGTLHSDKGVDSSRRCNNLNACACDKTGRTERRKNIHKYRQRFQPPLSAIIQNERFSLVRKIKILFWILTLSWLFRNKKTQKEPLTLPPVTCLKELREKKLAQHHNINETPDRERSREAWLLTSCVPLCPVTQ